MRFNKTTVVTILMFLCIPSFSFGSWQGPTEIVNGGWGTGDANFGIESGDTSDRFPSLAAILFDGRIVVSDQVNKRETIYKSDGTLLKTIPWDVYQNGTKTMNPDYPSNQYWNVQGYTPEGNVWIEISSKYALKSPTGQLIKTSTTRPLELGVVSQKHLGNKQYKVTVKYPDKEWSIIGRGAVPQYIRDLNGNLYGSGEKQAIRYSYCGKELARLTMPGDNIEEISRGAQLEPKINVLEEYGEPIIAPNGDVYTWKRTPTKYSIIKWTWVDDAKAAKESCSDQNTTPK